jgi:hypothetical protein
MQSDCEWARTVIRGAAGRYLDRRRERVEAFVDRHFSLAGTLRLHRRTLGWDVLRVPANLLLAPAALAMIVLGRLAARAGLSRSADWLLNHRPVIETAMAQEVEWLVMTELLQLPCEQAGRSHLDDALAETILADPRVASRLGAADVVSPEMRERIIATIAAYAGTRAAAAEIATGCFATTIGGLWLKHATPGMVTLGMVLAGTLAQQAAIAAFPLGAGLGAWWYALYPVYPSASLMMMTTGAFAVLGALFAVFAGVITDPLQRAMGLHRRRLLRLISALENALAGDAVASFPLRDHYIARLLDLMDFSTTLLRTFRG